MYEFQVLIVATNEIIPIFGYDINCALKRNGLDPNDVNVLSMEYVD